MVGKFSDFKQLEELEKIDAQIEENVASFNEIQEGKQIKKLRAQKSQFKQKRDVVDKLYVKAKQELIKISDEDSQVAAEIDKLQAKITATTGNYRKVEAYTQKLSELQTRRKQIDSNLESVEGNFNKIEGVRKKLDDAIGKVSMQEDDLLKASQEKAAVLKIETQNLQLKKREVENNISKDALLMYKNCRKLSGKRVISYLDGKSCSVCRSEISNLKMTTIKKQAPISACPNCHRLLLIDKS